MRVFTRVVDHGSFARAADALAVSRPTVTGAVSALEKRLGVRLLHRTTRRLSLTDEGRAYYATCVRLLDDLAEAEDALSSAGGAPRGRLRASLPQSFAHPSFFTALSGFTVRHPELVLELLFSDRVVNLVEEGVDCAVRGAAIPEDSTLVARRVGKACRVTCAAPAYLAAHGAPGSVAELAQHNCVRFLSPSDGRTLDWEFEENGTRTTFTPRGSLGVNSAEAAAAAAVAGIGIAQVPDSLVFHLVRSAQVQPVLLEHVTPAPPLSVVYPGNRYLTAKVRAFADFIAEIYPAEGWCPQIAACACGASPIAAAAAPAEAAQ